MPYTNMNPPNRKCKTCDKPLTDPLKSRMCPEPTLLRQFLEQNTEFSGETIECVMLLIYLPSNT